MRITNSAMQTYMLSSLKDSKSVDAIDRDKKEKEKAASTSSRVNTVSVDKVEISSAGMDKYSLIKSRIQSGFYTTAEVTQDISDKLGNAFSNLEPAQ
jgi:hypothetical protein